MKNATGFLEAADCLSFCLALREILLQAFQALREREHEAFHVWLLLRGVGAAIELGVLHVLEHLVHELLHLGVAHLEDGI